MANSPKLTFVLSTEIIEYLTTQAELQGRTISDVARRAIRSVAGLATDPEESAAHKTLELPLT